VYFDSVVFMLLISGNHCRKINNADKKVLSEAEIAADG